MVDLGCWPGGWLQVAAAAVGASGRVVGVDIAPMDPPIEIANVIAFQGDLGEASVIAALLEALGGPADVLLCDAAPKLTGVRDADRAHEGALLEAVERALPAAAAARRRRPRQDPGERRGAGRRQAPARAVHPGEVGQARREPARHPRALPARFGFRGSPKQGKTRLPANA